VQIHCGRASQLSLLRHCQRVSLPTPYYSGQSVTLTSTLFLVPKDQKRVF